MLHDLSFLDKGKSWPPESEAARIADYVACDSLRKGDVNAVWPDLYKYLRDGSTHQQDFYINFPWLATKKTIDTILGEPPAFSDGTDSYQLQAFLDEINYRQVLREQVADLDSFGDCVQKIWIDEGGQVQVTSIDPEHWFPVVKRGTRQIVYHVLVFEFEQKDKTYLEVEIHSPTEIEHRIIELFKAPVNGRTSTLGDPQPLEKFMPGVPDVEPNTAGEFLVITAHNQRMSGELFGISSYGPDFKSILKRIIIRYSLASNILDVFSRPTLVGPRNLETYDPVSGKSYFRPGEYKGVDFDPGVSPFVPQAVVWDAHMSEGDAFTRSLEEKLYQVAELPPVVLATSLAGTAESGTALRLRMFPLLSKCARMREEIDAAAKKALMLALKLAGKAVNQISITWQDGIPGIPLEDAQRAALLGTMPQFQGEAGGQWILENLGIEPARAKEIIADSETTTTEPIIDNFSQ